jgi:peptidoglycan/LPS O-acetylase OafA/YrhL
VVSSGSLSSTVDRARTSSRLPRLDLVRGLTAVYVAAYHCVDMLTASGRQFHDPGGATRMILDGNALGLLGFGHYAVLLFFLLSGFSIHLREWPELQRHETSRTWSKRYAVKRTLRIYPPLIAAVFVTYLLTRLGHLWFPDLFGQALTHPTAAGLTQIPADLSQAWSILVPVMNTGAVGSNPVFWSVIWEILFYCAYVPLVFAMKRSRRPPIMVLTWVAVAIEASRIAIAISGADSDAVARFSSIAAYFPVWLGGACLAELYRSRNDLSRVWRRVLIGVGIAGIAVLSLSADAEFRPEYDYLWALALAAVFAGVVFVRNQRESRVGSRVAECSYSLYLIHVPVLLFAFGAVADGTAPLSNPLLVTGIWGITLMAAWVMSACVERPSMRLAKTLLRR